MPVMVWDGKNGADRERYCSRPAKSHTLLHSYRTRRSLKVINAPAIYNCALDLGPTNAEMQICL